MRKSSKYWNIVKDLQNGINMKKILIIEDQPDIRKLIKLTMDTSESLVYEAFNAESGLAMVETLKPDIILLDIMMPGKIDGLQLCVILKSDYRFNDIPIILVTARGQLVDKQVGLEAGADEYIAKPFSPIKLIETVESLLLRRGKGCSA
jgi:two-component system, OmpR family, phosphate regulon response regulator PhoB